MRLGFVFRLLIVLSSTWLSVLLNAAPSSSTNATNNPALPVWDDYVVRRFTSADGLPHDMALAVLQTRDGYIWIGGLYGIARWDGVRFTHYNSQNTVCLRERDAVNIMLLDHMGVLWMHNSRKWVVWSGNTFVDAGGNPPASTLRRPPEEWPQWPAVSRELNRHVQPSESLSWFHWRWWLGTSDDGNSWFASSRSGLFLHKNGQLAIPDMGKTPMPEYPRCFLEDLEGNVWIGSHVGLYQFRRRVGRFYSKATGLPTDDTTSVSVAPDGAVWVAGRVVTNCAIGRIIGDRCETIPLDRIGDLRIESAGPILAHSAESADVAVFSATVSGPSWGVMSIRSNVASVSAFPVGRSWYFHKSSSGYVWTGFGNMHPTSAPPILRPWPTNMSDLAYAHDTVRVACEDLRTDTWLGTVGRGVVRLRFDRDAVAGTAGTPEFKTVAQEKIQLRTDYFDRRHGFKDLRILDIHRSFGGTLWIGTENGLHRMIPPTFGDDVAGTHVFAFTTDQGLPENTVNSVLEDDHGFLWLGGNQGIHRIRKSDLDAVAMRTAAAVAHLTIDDVEQLGSAETCQLHSPKAGKGPDGRLWFGTSLGVAVVDPAKVSFSDVAPLINIEQFVADDEIILGDGTPVGRTVANAGVIRLSPGRARQLAIRYTSPQFNHPERARFRVRLTGHNGQWRDMAGERTAHYTNLRPGSYVFEVTACNAQGIWQPTPARIAFELLPQFTQTAWFPASIAVGGIGIAMGLAMWRLRWQRRFMQSENSLSLEKERSRIAFDLHDELGSGLAQASFLMDDQRSDTGKAATKLLRSLAGRLDEIVWLLHSSNGSVEQTVHFLAAIAENFVSSTPFRFRLHMEDMPVDLQLSSEQRRNLVSALREMLKNAVTHSGGSQIEARFLSGNGHLVVEVRDNGAQGIGQGRVNSNAASVRGNGLLSLRRRAEELGGEFTLRHDAGTGSVARLSIPMGAPKS